MSDFLLELSKNPNARKLIQTLGLPHSAAAGARAGARAVARAAAGRSPRRRRRGAGRHAVAGAGGGAGRGRRRAVPRRRRRSTRRPSRPPARPTGGRRASLDSARATSRAGRSCSTPPASTRSGGAARALRLLPSDRRQARAARAALVVLGRALEDVSNAGARRRRRWRSTASCARLAKEVGRKGATANLVRVDADAHGRVPPLLRWLAVAARGLRHRRSRSASALRRRRPTAPTAKCRGCARSRARSCS